MSIATSSATTLLSKTNYYRNKTLLYIIFMLNMRFTLYIIPLIHIFVNDLETDVSATKIHLYANRTPRIHQRILGDFYMQKND